MNDFINIKTDASFRSEDGFGVAYVATFNNGGRVNKEITGNKYYPDKVTSTKAEMWAVIWSLHDLHNTIDDFRERRVVVRTDCKDTVRKFDDEYCKQKQIRLIRRYSSLCNDFDIFWIPRTSNKKPDSLARKALERGSR